jgi:hypothetical protein
MLAAVTAPWGHGLGARTSAAGAVQRPNIVFVLTDDLDWSLVTAQYMPHVIALERNGETFDHYIVADSLCCPSRTSIFTGLFPHDSGVYTNTGTDGGYYAFTHHRPNLETRTFAVVMQKAGYLTSMMGKYLNGYDEPAMTTQVPPGWSDWHVAGNAYPEFNYDLNENGAVVHYGPGPPPAANAANYLTDVLASRATAFIDRAAAAHKPFVMEVATFAPIGRTRPRLATVMTFRASGHHETHRSMPPTQIPRTGSAGASDSRLRRWQRSTASTGCALRPWRPSIVCSAWSRRDWPLGDWRAAPTSCSAPTTDTTWASTGCCRAKRPPSTPTSASR